MNYRAYPSALVDKVEVDVAGLKVGDTIRVKDLSLAKDKDIDIKDDPEAVVLTVVTVHNGAVPETVTPEEETEEALWGLPKRPPVWQLKTLRGGDLIVAKVECPPQTPPFWSRLAHQDRTVLTPTV